MPKFIIKRKAEPKAEPTTLPCENEMITEISCEACDCSIKVNITPEEQERGKYPNYCDFCERVKDAFDCGELPAVQAGNIAEIAIYIRDKLALKRSK